MYSSLSKENRRCTAAILNILRQELMKDPELSDFVKSAKLRKDCTKESLFAFSMFFSGLVLVTFASESVSIWYIVGSLAIVIALSSVSSLLHESWHILEWKNWF